MSNERPAGSGGSGARGEWDADAPDAWDEPGSAGADDAHGRESREHLRAHEDDRYADYDEQDPGYVGDPDDGYHGYDERDEYDEHHDNDDRYGHDDAAGAAGARHDGGDGGPGGGRRRIIVLAIAAALLIGGLVVAVGVVWPVVQRFTAPTDYEGAGTGSAEVVVSEGDTGSQIGQKLQQAGIVLTPEAFTQALTDNPGDEIQPGHYSLRKEMAASEALSMMRNEGRNVTRVTIREGLWKSEVYNELSRVTGTPVEQYQQVEEQAKADPSILGLPSSAKGALEGYLFPATYDFDPGTDARTQLRQMVSHAMTQLRQLGVADANMERVMTIASLVEGEARTDEDRPKVARVIENRLADNMPLQMDSTVNYAAQRRSITTSDQERAAGSPYNTYAHPGLPPGPINNPGADSITAAQNPADGNWLYFVTVNPDTGQTVFTATLAEHNQQVRVFQQWCQANPGKC
ncbi:endolytic transglycosylase MltG [Piscicoccus intestinalis]|uniref:endolytic transglycosylase MltG n=1 Tax=Piscicoccus intestinalis TaxID=746033 RepID=UPI000838C7D4|nr:endolytic transglycosylase MltG [Piscicoccus intestinalis]